MGILASLAAFMADEFPQWSITKCQKKHKLTQSTTHMSRLVLKRLMANGLLVKRDTAELALSLTPSRHRQVRDGMPALTGRQSRYVRLSPDGCRRALEIQRLQARLRQAQKCVDHETSQRWQDMMLLLDTLKGEHAMMNLEERYHLLRHDIRHLIRLGAEKTTKC